MQPRDPLLPGFLSTPFPWRGGNQFNLHVNGERFFPPMLAAIQGAKQSIALEMYLCGSGRVFSEFRDALMVAAQRGVTTQVLLDDFGSLQLNKTDREQMLNAGVELKFYNPLRWQQGLRNFLRNHRKLLVVDGEIAFTGGAGLTDEFVVDGLATQAWHDVMLEIHGPVVNDWQRLFDHTWLGLRKRVQLRRSLVLRPERATKPISGDTPGTGRIIASYGPQAHHVLQSLYAHIKLTKQRAWIVTPYFMPSWKLRQRLIKAARHGVDTRVLVPGAMTDHPTLRQASRRHYAQLLKQGVRIFEYQPTFIHTKLAICDDWISVGSTNFDHWNLRWNLDANQEVQDAAFVIQVLAMLDADFAASVELLHINWQRRPWYLRLTEWLTGLLDRWSSNWR